MRRLGWRCIEIGIPVVLLGIQLGCKDSFENSDLKAFVLPDTALPQIPEEMARRDSIQVGVQVATDTGAGGKKITGASAAWTTSDARVVTVRQTAPLQAELTATGF